MRRNVEQIERRYFDQLVAEEGDFDPFADRAWQILAGLFTWAIGNRTGLDVLDVGCGTGRSRAVYARHAGAYAGIDLAFNPLRVARSHRPAAEWLQADALLLPFAEEVFDIVAFSSVLHHLPDRQAALQEALRVLRPGGTIFAFDPHLLHPPMALFRHPSSPFYISQGVSPMERPLLGRTLRHDFAMTGCVDIRQRVRSGLPYRAVAPRFLNSGLAVYNALDALLQASGLGRWIGSFVITVGRHPGRRSESPGP